jgi:hypothetical protein
MSIRAHVQKAKWIQVLVTLVALPLYLVSFSWFLHWLLPQHEPNVNAVFAGVAWKWTLVVAGLYVVLLGLFRLYPILKPYIDRYILPYIFAEGYKENKVPRKTKKSNKPAFKNSIEKLDFILILLPLTPVVQYILGNQDTLSPLGSLYVFAVFAVFSVLFVIVVPALLGMIGSTKTLMILGLALTSTITNMAALSALLNWYERGYIELQLGVLSAVFLGCWIVYNLIGRKVMYVVVVVVFITNTAINLSPQDWTKRGPSSESRLVNLVGSKQPQFTPNIYLLVYDAYQINETMLQYGIDNSAQEEYLEALGFELYPHTYSVADSTIDSMSRVLDASAELYGRPQTGTSGDGTVQNLLRRFGYETYGLFPMNFFFQGIGSSYDFSLPEAPSGSTASSHDSLMKGIFMGEFRFDEGMDEESRHKFMEDKLAVLGSVPDNPRFVYMHDFLPGHSQLSGKCRPDETAVFKGKLDLANDEMKQDIETITQNDPGAIVVVAGDHGPYLTRNCTPILAGLYDISEISRLDIQDRFGTFLAIRWPTEDFSEYDDITVLQDMFPAIFAYLFKDGGFLEARVASTTDSYETIGASVTNGIISGGINDGEPLFVD